MLKLTNDQIQDVFAEVEDLTSKIDLLNSRIDALSIDDLGQEEFDRQDEILTTEVGLVVFERELLLLYYKDEYGLDFDI